MSYVFLSAGEAIGGAFAFIFCIGLAVFLISLFSRVTGTKVRMRGGAIIPAFRTPSELKDEQRVRTVELFLMAHESLTRKSTDVKSIYDLSALTEDFTDTIAEREGTFRHNLEIIINGRVCDTVVKSYNQLLQDFSERKISSEEYCNSVIRLYDYAIENS